MNSSDLYALRRNWGHPPQRRTDLPLNPEVQLGTRGAALGFPHSSGPAHRSAHAWSLGRLVEAQDDLA